MAEDVEILVHISAPSTSKDDTAYRDLARAYLDFQPGKSTKLAATDPLSAEAAPAASTSTLTAEQRQARTNVLLPASLDSPLASFQGVWDNITSPVPLAAAAAAWHPRSSQRSDNGNPASASASSDSWVQPPSEVPDSMPYNDLSLAGFTTPTRVLNYFLQTHGPAVASPPSQGTVAAAGLAEATTVYANDTDVGVGDSTMLLLQGACVSEVHEASSSASLDQPPPPAAAAAAAAAAVRSPSDMSSVLDITSGRTHVTQTPSSLLQRRRRSPRLSHTPPRQAIENASRVAGAPRLVCSSEASVSDGWNVVIPATQPVERADSAPPLAKRQRRNPPTHDGEIQSGGGGLNRSASDILPRGATSQFLDPPLSSQIEINDLLQEITDDDDDDDDDDGGNNGTNPFAPQKLTGPDWSSLLELMAADPPPSDKILGHEPTMFLESLFRSAKGHQRYRPHFQARDMRAHERGFWTLTLAGWPSEAKRRTWHFLGNYIRKDVKAGWGTRACRDQAWSWFRLYGWEHIAGELYILLYLASERRTNYVEMVWRDGAGEALIVVGPRAEEQPLTAPKMTERPG